MLLTLQIIGAITVLISVFLAILIVIVLTSEKIKEREEKQRQKIYYLNDESRKSLIKKRNEIDKLLAQLE